MKDYPYMSESPVKEVKKRTVRNKQAFPNKKTALFKNQCDGTYHWVEYVRLAQVPDERIRPNDMFRHIGF